MRQSAQRAKATLVLTRSRNSNAGTVSEVDAIGTVAQGVVNYAIKIFFETQDNRVKTGMSVSAAIGTDLRRTLMVRTQPYGKTAKTFPR